MGIRIAPKSEPVLSSSQLGINAGRQLSHGLPRTKESNTPALSRSSAAARPPGNSNTGTNTASHAPDFRRPISTSTYTPSSSTPPSPHTKAVSTSLNVPVSSGGAVMSANAKIKPNLQPAPTPSEVQALRNTRIQPARSQPPQNAIQLESSQPSSAVNQQVQHIQPSPSQVLPSTHFNAGTQSPENEISSSHHFLPGSQPPNSGHSHSAQAVHYLHGPYGQQSGPYPVAEDGRVLMAATMSQYPNVYSSSQPQSPASVQSPHAQDVQGQQYLARSHRMPPTMYTGYPQYQAMGHVPQSPYAHNHSPQGPPNLAPQPLLMSQTQPNPQMSQQHGRSPTSVGQSPRQKLDPSGMSGQHPVDSTGAMHRAAPQLVANTQIQPNSAGSNQQSPRSGGDGANSTAAPGPIPASTPRVIREDADGTLWIEFEYSKDRVKMEYSIKCNVRSVNLDDLTEEFKTANCVYPRAMKPKEEYQGNRYNYETECNNVGWALAKMNETLQGKRGLIQRAVDSWRNSSQDSKLRSRRVRRQQKIAKREKEPSRAPGQGSVMPGTPMSVQRPGSMHGSLDMTGATGFQHSGVVGPSAVAGGNDNVVTGAGLPASSFSTPSLPRSNSLTQSGNHEEIGQLTTANSSRTHPDHTVPRLQHSPITDKFRSGQFITSEFPGGAVTATESTASRSGGAIAIASGEKRKRESDDDLGMDLWGGVPASKRPKFILVEDRNKANRVRVKVMLDHVKMGEIPDSFRQNLSVYYRAYKPAQLSDLPGQIAERTGGRWPGKGSDDGKDTLPTASGKGMVPRSILTGGERSVVGRTTVKLQNINGGDTSEALDSDGNDGDTGKNNDGDDVSAHIKRERSQSASTRRQQGEYAFSIPYLSPSKWHREEMLNELGYRMSWNQNRVFDGRLLLLQRCLDQYRGKMKAMILTASHENESGEGVGITSPVRGEHAQSSPGAGGRMRQRLHFETRLGKRRWLAGKNQPIVQD